MKLLQQVLDTYARHIQRLLLRATKQERQLTEAETRGVAFYRAAATDVQRLMEQ